MIGQLHEALPATARHDDGDRATSELADETSARNLPHSPHRTTEGLGLSNRELQE